MRAQPTVTISPQRVLRLLCATALAFVAVGAGAHALVHRFGCEGLACTAAKALDVDAEANLPTWYSASLLLVTGILSAIAGGAARAAGEPHVRRWRALAAVFLAMSLDEIATLHEHVSALLRAKAHLGGLLHNAWVLPAAAFVLVFGAWMLPLVRALPTATRRRFVLAGAIYLSGAVGLEVVDGAYAYRFGEESYGYVVLTGLEELGEMLGLSVMIYALLAHVGARGVSVSVGMPPAAPPSRRHAAVAARPEPPRREAPTRVASE